MLAIYLPYVAVLTLVEALEDMLDQRRELRPAEVATAAPTTWAAEAQVLSEARNRAAELGACRCVTCVIWFLERSVQLGAWLFEVREAKRQQEFGARIKWRRLCLLLGTFGLIVSAWNAVQRILNVTPWEELLSEFTYLTGQHAYVSDSPGSVLAPLVDRYALARNQQLGFSLLGAVLFLTAVAFDIFGKHTALFWQRFLGMAGAGMYITSMVSLNLPNYVGMLDFRPTLGHCGAKFCTEVATSMASALGTGMLANSAMHFVPILVSLPWTLFRIAFFLAVDQANRDVVFVLTWCTMSCLPRLSLLPATMAYVYNPDSLIVDWYVIFLLATMGLMVLIHATGRKGLGWYFLWGWVFFLVPLLMMASVALEESYVFSN